MTRGTTACLLFSACLVSFIGCGGRTDTLFDEAGAGGLVSAGGDGPGGNSVGGNGPYIAGAPSVAGSSGAPSFAGTPSVGGFPNVGGAPNVAGAPSVGGFTNIGGSIGFAGMPNFGGMTGIAGFPGFPGDAGAGGVGGVIVDACVSVAPGACEKCQCQVCADQVVGCFTDLGCASIFACIQKTGCQGFNCYTNAACRKVINQFGGPTGSAVSEVFALGSCALSSQTACACN